MERIDYTVIIKVNIPVLFSLEVALGQRSGKQANEVKKATASTVNCITVTRGSE